MLPRNLQPSSPEFQSEQHGKESEEHEKKQQEQDQFGGDTRMSWGASRGPCDAPQHRFAFHAVQGAIAVEFNLHDLWSIHAVCMNPEPTNLTRPRRAARPPPVGSTSHDEL